MGTAFTCTLGTYGMVQLGFRVITCWYSLRRVVYFTAKFKKTCSGLHLALTIYKVKMASMFLGSQQFISSNHVHV